MKYKPLNFLIYISLLTNYTVIYWFPWLHGCIIMGTNSQFIHNLNIEVDLWFQDS